MLGFLIDMDGVVLETVRLDAMPDLPLLIGPAANLHAAELARLTQAAPNLRPAMAGVCMPDLPTITRIGPSTLPPSIIHSRALAASTMM